MRAWGPVPLGLEPSRQDDPTAQRRQRHERVGDQEGPSDRVAPHLRPLVFFGALDPGKLSFAERSLRKLPAARAMLPEGDFRDWAEIETWPAASPTSWLRRRRADAEASEEDPMAKAEGHELKMLVSAAQLAVLSSR